MTGVDWTERYPWIVEDVARLNVQHAIIDAECCCDGEDGVTDFERLMAACTMPAPTPMRSTCWRSTATTCDAAAQRSKSDAREAAAEGEARHPLQRTHDRRRPDIFEHACKMGLEGIVSKRINAPYRSGKVKFWLKTKNPKAAAVLRVQEGGW